MALNRADRLRAAVERDGPTCIWCGRAFTPLDGPTTEHVVPRLKGGPSWLENEVAACRRCNSDRGHRGPVEWLEDCVRRGWRPDEARLERALVRLTGAITRAGGQRRARPYLETQLRRLRRRADATVGSVGQVTQAGRRVVGRVEEIWVYPVKSLAGIALTTVEMDPTGPRGDRTSAVVDAGSGELVRAKHAPVLATLAPTGDAGADEQAIGAALGHAVRLEATTGSAGGAGVHLVSRQAVERAALGDVPDGCSAEDPRANLLVSLPDDDERTWVGRLLTVGDVVLEVTRTPKHCLGVYAEVRESGAVSVGDAILL